MPASKFVASIQNFAELARTKMESGSRAAVAAMAKIIIERSPVGAYPETSDHPGAFRGNWTLAVSMPFTADTNKRDVDGGPTYEAIVEALSGIDFSSDWHVFISNHLPYAVRLENGWSGQAPSPPG